MPCYIRQLPLDLWSHHVLPMLQLKHLVLLDSAVAGGSTLTILREGIFPSSKGQSLLYGGKQRQLCVWCLKHGILISELRLFCHKPDYNEQLETLCPHKHLIGQIALRCEGEVDLVHTLRRLAALSLDDLVGPNLVCGHHFDPPFRQSLLAEEVRLCRRLKDIRCYALPNECSPGVVAWLTACLEYSTQVESIEVSDMLNLTTATFQTAAFRANTLTTLTFYRCNVTNAMAQCIGDTCKQLRQLTVNWNGKLKYFSFKHVPDADLLGDSGLLAIAQGCPQLEEVHVEDLRCDNPAVLEAFAKGCPRLRMLRAAQCTVSTAALAALAEHGPGPVSLHATWAGTAEEWTAALQKVQHRWLPSNFLFFHITDRATGRVMANYS